MSPTRTLRAWSSRTSRCRGSSTASGACAPVGDPPRASASRRPVSRPSAHGPVRRGDAAGGRAHRRSRMPRLRPPSLRSPWPAAPRCLPARRGRPAPLPSLASLGRRPRSPTIRSRTASHGLDRLDDGAPSSTWCRRSKPARPSRPLPAARRDRPPAVRQLQLRRPPPRSVPPLRTCPIVPSRLAHDRHDDAGAEPRSCPGPRTVRRRSRPMVRPPHQGTSPWWMPRRSSEGHGAVAPNPWQAAGWSRLAVARAPGLPPRAPAALRRARGILIRPAARPRPSRYEPGACEAGASPLISRRRGRGPVAARSTSRSVHQHTNRASGTIDPLAERD